MWPPKVDPALLDSQDTDIVILVMGAAGAGKSTFINCYLEAIDHPTRVEIGGQLSSCTVQIQPIVVEGQIGISFPYLPLDARVVVVDTPGFDDSFATDLKILKRISTWLQESYRKDMVLGGVIYIHDISHYRFSGSARRNLQMLHRSCGDAALSKVVLVTSNWSWEQGEEFELREQELKHVHWDGMIRGGDGAAVMRLEPGNEGQSAVNVVNVILKNVDRRSGETLRQEIQGELGPRKGYLAYGNQAAIEWKEQLLDAQTEMLALEERVVEGDPEAEMQLRETQEKVRYLADQVRQPKVRRRKAIVKWFKP